MRSFNPPHLTDVQERLEYILDLTRDFKQTQFQIAFGDKGFARQRRDKAVWDESGNQVGHFLQAVAMGYEPGFYASLTRTSADIGYVQFTPDLKPFRGRCGIISHSWA